MEQTRTRPGNVLLAMIWLVKNKEILCFSSVTIFLANRRSTTT